MNRPPASSEAVLRRMKRQKRKDTVPEIEVRKLLHRLGRRFRVQNRDLPGSPDIANRARRWAVFVHGCYWHHHEGCSRATVPKKNRDFWLDKFRRNRERDARNEEKLRQLGYRVVVVWECESLDADHLATRLQLELGPA